MEHKMANFQPWNMDPVFFLRMDLLLVSLSIPSRSKVPGCSRSL